MNQVFMVIMPCSGADAFYEEVSATDVEEQALEMGCVYREQHHDFDFVFVVDALDAEDCVRRHRLRWN